MAEQIHYRPAEAKRLGPETEQELERLEARLAEINGLLDELYASGLIRWLKDFAGAMPEVSSILVQGLNTESGRAGMRNLMIAAQQLGSVDPDRLQRVVETANAGLDAATSSSTVEDSAYNPPGVTGMFRLLHDKQLWATLGPAIEGIRAFSRAREAGADPDGGNTDSTRDE